jgi:N-acetylmuramoyl-L-alanine amidase
MVGLFVTALVAPFVVCLDPGHPSENGAGAVGTKVREVELVWDLAKRTEKLLTAYQGRPIKVVLTKNAEHEMVTNRKRAEVANLAHADLFLRIHADSGGHSGIATYFPDGQATVQGVFGPSKAVIEASQALATPFHAGMVRVLGDALPDLGCRSEKKTFIGGKQGALTGTVFATVPVLLVEVCAVDNEHDAAFVSDEKGRDRLAKALAAGVEAVAKAP